MTFDSTYSEVVESHYDPFEVMAMSFEFQSLEQSELEYAQKVHLPLASRVQDHFAQLLISRRRWKRCRRSIKGLECLDVVHQNAIASVVV